tara:strand:- start:225 stop:932 length:708 start_codon:yes stop_codon:yes gene_type:complete
MNLSFKSEGVQSESSQNYMEPGLDVPARLIEVDYGKDRDGNKTDNLSFTFEGTSKENSGKMIYTVWASTFDRQGEYNKSKDDKKFQGQVDREISRIFHVLTAYAEESQVENLLDKSDNKIKKAFELIIAAMKSIDFKETDLELKITLDKKGRTQFPTFPNFVRSQHTPGRTFRVDNKVNPNTGLPNDIMSRSQLPQQPAQGASSGFGASNSGFGASEEEPSSGGFGFGSGQKNPF